MIKKKDKLLREVENLEAQVQQIKSSLADVVKAVKGEDEGKIRTYIEGFDEALDGGIQRKHVILISGITGTLKSSLALSILYHNLKKNGSKGLYMSIEEPKESLVKTMQDLNFNEYSEKDLIIVDVGRMRMEHKDVDEEKDWFRVIKDYLEKKVKTHEVSLFVLDSLTALTSLAQPENSRADLFQFFSFLKSLGITSFLITESTTDGAAAIPGVENSLSDGLINLGFFEANGRVEWSIRCVKLRHSNHSLDYFTLSHSEGKFVASLKTTSTNQ